MREQGGGHAHVWAAVAAEELDAAGFELELFVTEDPGEGVAAAFRPFRVVVAGYDPVGIPELVDQFLGHRDLIVGAEFGDVAAEDRELDVFLTVDVGDAALEIVDARRAFGEMDIRQKGKLDRCGLGADGKGQHHCQ